MCGGRLGATLGISVTFAGGAGSVGRPVTVAWARPPKPVLHSQINTKTHKLFQSVLLVVYISQNICESNSTHSSVWTGCGSTSLSTWECDSIGGSSAYAGSSTSWQKHDFSYNSVNVQGIVTVAFSVMCLTAGEWDVSCVDSECVGWTATGELKTHWTIGKYKNQSAGKLHECWTLKFLTFTTL